MKKINLFSVFIVFQILVFNQNVFGQIKLKDKNSKLLYSYLLDSVLKIKENKIIKKPFTIAKETNSFNFLQNNLFGGRCYFRIYENLKERFKIDSIELSKLKIEKRILTKYNIDTKKYTLVDNNFPEPDVYFSEPVYCGNKNISIISTYVYSFHSSVHVFFKEKNKWIYFNSYCVTME